MCSACAEMDSRRANAFEMMMRAAKDKESVKTKRYSGYTRQQSPKKLCIGDSGAAAAAASEGTQQTRHSLAGQEISAVKCSPDGQLSAVANAGAAAAVDRAITCASFKEASAADLHASQHLGVKQTSFAQDSTHDTTVNATAVAARPAEQPPVAAQLQPQQQPQPATAVAGLQHAAAVAAFKNAFQGKSALARQKFQYLAVYDLEATCNKTRSLQPIEIIELSCVLVDTRTAQITNTFQAYVQPSEHPQLDPFCVELTGIQQHQIDSAQPLLQVLEQHHKWLQQQGMFDEGVKFLAVTWTDWDFAVCLCAECAWRRIQRPDYLCSWVDLKRQFYAKYKQRGNLRTCVEAAGLRWQGRAHSGLDDAANTARLAIKLMTQGTVLDVTQTSENPPVQQQRLKADTQGSGDGTISSTLSSRNHSRAKAAMLGSRGSAGVMMCKCGVKAQLRTTKRPGPNQGRQFYSCGTWTITAQQSRGCGFFVWTDELADA